MESTRPLYFDYTQQAAVAVTSLFGSGAEYSSEVPEAGALAATKDRPAGRTLPAGQPVQVWVELRVPDSAYQELVQVGLAAGPAGPAGLGLLGSNEAPGGGG